MHTFSLSQELKGLYGKQLNELSKSISEYIKNQVIPNLKNIESWDSLSPEEKHSAALITDYLQNSTTKKNIKYWDEFTQRINKLQIDLKNWKSTSASTASDLSIKESKIEQLKVKISALERKQKNAKPNLMLCEAEPQNYDISGKPIYISYPAAYKLLADRLNATPEEIVGWIQLGTEQGGLDAYIGVKELPRPLIFIFDHCIGDNDYLSHLMTCWFRADDIAKFEPDDRFITGAELFKLWENEPGIKVEAFVRAKILEGELHDYQPIGENDQTIKNNNLKTALYLWSEIETINMEEFGRHPLDISKLNTDYYPNNILQFSIDRLKIWAKENISDLNSLASTISDNSSEKFISIKQKINDMDQLISFLSKTNRSSTAQNDFNLQNNNILPFATANEIIRHFHVYESYDENEKWWKSAMRNASDTTLKNCRVGNGKKGPGGSLWRPDEVAGWLVDRYEKNLQGMSINEARSALKKFKGYEEIAEDFFYVDK